MWKQQRAAQPQAALHTERTQSEIHSQRPLHSNFSKNLARVSWFSIAPHTCSDLVSLTSVPLHLFCNHLTPVAITSFLFFLSILPSGFLPSPTLAVVFLTTVHTRAQHKAENIPNLG